LLTTPEKPLRLWPGVVAVALQWLVWLVIPTFAPQTGGSGLIGGVLGGLLVLVWWVFLSRAAWLERLGAIALMVVAAAATSRLVHESIANGMMGFMFFIYSIPVMSLALVTWAAASRRVSRGLRHASLIATILLACATLTLIRTDGITGDADSDIEWRWTQTPEQRLLAAAGGDTAARSAAPATVAAPPEKPLSSPTREEAPASASAPTAAAGAEKPPAATAAETGSIWPGFRGPNRDGVVGGGIRIETDWSMSPPVEMWRRPVGPGWSSFAVRGDRVYTQEQRGEDEVVSAYNLNSGEPVWRHRNAARFWESNAGAGPRGTPALSDGRVYTLGATGILNALDARDGSLLWSRNAASDTGATVPDWGIASSPLVIDDVVIAAAAGSLAAYDAATGNPRWFGPKEGWGYSSPHLSTIGGVTQIVLLNGAGAISVAPTDGKLLWKHTWPSDGILQPAVIAGSDVLIGSGSGLATHTGMQRVTVAHEPGGWSVKERWTSTGLKPYFNDFVVHGGHAFGFDGSILACIDLNDGTRKWKGGRYGHGQLVLLPEQDLLLVLSEDGELVLVRATADQFMELARFPAIEGKTWNHPALAGNVVLVRNGEEMAAFRLPLATR
jgi:outer membrane protein assembly factor BamB